MTDQRKRLTKDASKILFQIICEEEYEGKTIKDILPATRRISKRREGLWEYIRVELERRSGEEYDMGTVSAAWYYNLRKIGSCVDQLDGGVNSLEVNRLKTLARYVCGNMGDRLKKEAVELNAPHSVVDGEEGVEDVKPSAAEMIALSRQETVDVRGGGRGRGRRPALKSMKTITLDRAPSAAGTRPAMGGGVKVERRSQSEEKVKRGGMTRAEEEGENEGHEGMGDDDDMQMAYDDAPLMMPPSREATAATQRAASGRGAVVPSRISTRTAAFPPPSRYTTAHSEMVSRENSTRSASGYDADCEKGILKQRRKVYRMRGQREPVMKEEEEEEKGEDEQREEEKEEGEAEGEGEGEKEEEEEHESVVADAGMEIGDEKENEGVGESGERREEKEKMVDHLMGMIDNLRDHCLSLKGIGVLEESHMESLADAFENAANSVANNI